MVTRTPVLQLVELLRADLSPQENVAIARCAAVIAECEERAAHALGNALMLVTCERLLLAWTSTEGADRGVAWLEGLLGEWMPDACARRLQSAEDLAAIRRLLELAVGARSRIVGEREIFEQLRRAMARARRTQALHGELDRCLARIVGGARHVRRHFAYSDTPTPQTLGARTMRFIEQYGASNASLCIVGAGHVMQSLVAAAPPGCRIDIVSRRAPKRDTPGHVTVTMWPWESLEARINASPVVIVATGSPTPLLQTSSLPEVETGECPLWIDLSEPANVLNDAPGRVVLRTRAGMDHAESASERRAGDSVDEATRARETLHRLVESEMQRLEGERRRRESPTLDALSHS